MSEIASTLDVEATAEQWAALLASLPACSGCKSPAVVRLRENGASFVTCASCATSRPRARVEELPHGVIVTAIEKQLRDATSRPVLEERR